MKRNLQTLIIAIGLALGLGTFLAAPAGAINVFNDKTCPADSTSAVCKASGDTVQSPVRNVISTLLIAIGIISIIMIIIGGIRYTLSNGNSAQIESAKNTVLYAVVGLIVAMLAYTIVNFVVGQF